MPHFAWTRGSKLWPWLYYGVQRSARVVCWVVLTLLFVCWKGCNCHQLCDVVRVVSISLTIVSMWHAHNCSDKHAIFCLLHSLSPRDKSMHARAQTHIHTTRLPLLQRLFSWCTFKIDYFGGKRTAGCWVVSVSTLLPGCLKSSRDWHFHEMMRRTQRAISFSVGCWKTYCCLQQHAVSNLYLWMSWSRKMQ